MFLISTNLLMTKSDIITTVGAVTMSIVAWLATEFELNAVLLFFPHGGAASIIDWCDKYVKDFRHKKSRICIDLMKRLLQWT
jgi:hypothetical protein